MDKVAWSDSNNGWMLVYRTMKKLFVIALMFLSALSAGAQSSLVSQISAACAAAESVQCNFTQTRHLAMMEEAIVSTGKMSYRRPDFLRWEYVSP